MILRLFLFFFFFFNDTATTEIYTLSLHDALPISLSPSTRTASSSAPPAPARAISRRPSAWRSSNTAYRVLYREAHALVDELAEAQLAGARKQFLAQVTTVPLLVLDDLGMKRLPHTAAEDLLEIVMRRYERASTLITSNRPVEDWGKLLGDTAAVTALLDRLLHHAHVLTCGPRSWRTRLHGERAVSGA